MAEHLPSWVRLLPYLSQVFVFHLFLTLLPVLALTHFCTLPSKDRTVEFPKELVEDDVAELFLARLAVCQGFSPPLLLLVPYDTHLESFGVLPLS